MSISRFLVAFSVFTIFLALLALSIQYMAGNTPVLIPKFWVIFGTLAFLTLTAYLVSVYGIRQGGEFSGYTILGTIVFKFLFFLALVAVYLLKFKVNHVLFIANFFSLYFLFTGFEVYCLLSNLRHQNKN